MRPGMNKVLVAIFTLPMLAMIGLLAVWIDSAGQLSALKANHTMQCQKTARALIARAFSAVTRVEIVYCEHDIFGRRLGLKLYAIHEIEEIASLSRFGSVYAVERVTIQALPIFMLITLRKPSQEFPGTLRPSRVGYNIQD